ncbi:MAG: hypothetical protein IPG59_01110 [Candidatus Melainabacteria bacterium]|nr:MAG: hypothetical protein IPG59_01110 [Candidatus Melainabacteria bacterium]
MASVNKRKVSLADYKIFECTKCKCRFQLTEGDDKKKVCPSCGNIDAALLPAIFTKNDKQVENLYNEGDFHGG